MNKKDAAQFKKLLIQKKTELLNKVNAQKERDSDADIIVGDEIDTASQNSEKEMYFELAANDKITLDAINDALAKIEKGLPFGKCECCGCEIPIERIKAIPWVRYCIQCQEEAERPKK